MPEGRRTKSFKSLLKPNPLRDGDGKPRVSVDLSDCSFSVFHALPEIAIFKDSRAAECDIVKLTQGDARFVCRSLKGGEVCFVQKSYRQ